MMSNLRDLPDEKRLGFHEPTTALVDIEAVSFLKPHMSDFM
jgi:hypothetical protein